MTHLRGRAAGKYHTPLDFGAIGSGLSAAIGVAVARGSDKVMLIDGDGSLYQHIQELETVRRHGLKLLICILNDGGYGAESHKFRAYGVNPEHAIHGRGDIAAIARGFGHNAATVTEMGQLERLFRDHQQLVRHHPLGRPHRRFDPVAQFPPRSLRRGVSRARNAIGQIEGRVTAIAEWFGRGGSRGTPSPPL